MRYSVPAGGWPTMGSMPAATTPPVRELLEWVALRPRSYKETMAAWTTHCPRLSTWEDALAGKLVKVVREAGGSSKVVLTDAGRAAVGT
jgi:hypothetical protein